MAGAKISLRAKFKSAREVEVCIMRKDTNEVLLFVLPIKWSDDDTVEAELVEDSDPEKSGNVGLAQTIESDETEPDDEDEENGADYHTAELPEG